MLGALQRPADLLARYGGEEFVLLLPQTDAQGAWHVAQALVQAVDALALPHPAQPGGGCVTISVGVASGGADPATLVAAADAALYEAKRAGRHRASLGAADA